MKLRHIGHFLRDLIAILPSRTRREWIEVENLKPDRPTVILLSGFAATNRNLSIMRKRLMKDGYNVLVLPIDWQALSDGLRGLHRMSERLSLLVVKLRKGKVQSSSRIFLVAHSAGGLVARHYVQLLGGFHYCDGLITLATPHRGTWLSVLGLFSHLILKARVLVQMTPSSYFIKKINRAGLPEGFPFVSLGSTEDFLCPPNRSRLPEGMKAETRVLHGLSHGDFLVSKRCYAVIQEQLGKFHGGDFVATNSQVNQG